MQYRGERSPFLFSARSKTALCLPRLAVTHDSTPRTCSEGQRDRRELCVHAYLHADTRAYNPHIYHTGGQYYIGINPCCFSVKIICIYAKYAYFSHVYQT